MNLTSCTYTSTVNTNLQIFLYSFIGLISLLSNLLIILVITTKKKMRTLSNFLLVNLAVSDVLVTLFGVPPTIQTLETGKCYSGALCDAIGFMIFLSFVGSVLNLTLIAIHRYLLIVKNAHYKIVFHGKRTLAAISWPWLVSIILGVLPLAGWGRYKYDYGRAHCMTDWGFTLSYLIFVQILVYLVPLIILTYSYIEILKSTSQSRKRLVASVDRANLAQRQREHQLTRMLITVVVCFFVCFTPYAILVQMEGIFQKHIHQVHSLVAMLFAYMNSVFDFWIYSLMSTKFRRALRHLLYRRTRRVEPSNSLNNLPIPEEKKQTCSSSTSQLTSRRLSDIQGFTNKNLDKTNTDVRRHEVKIISGVVHDVSMIKDKINTNKSRQSIAQCPRGSQIPKSDT